MTADRVHRPWTERMPWVWATICLFLVIAVAVSIVVGVTGVTRANEATHRATVAARKAHDAAARAHAVANCINANLGKRSIPTALDAAAHIAFARAVDGLFLPPNATPKQRLAEDALFKRQVQAYVDALVADQAQRDAHPLGRC